MLDIKALVLAAGMGTRLRPYTNHLPKCLMPIRGVPLLGYWINKIEACGIGEIFINTHYLSDLVLDYTRTKSSGPRITVLHEEHLLGTAGTIRANYASIAESRLLVIHGDNWSECNINDLIAHHLNRRPQSCPITMMTFTSEDPSSCGIVEKDSHGTLVAFYEKVKEPPGNEANAAIYLLEPEVVRQIAEDHSGDDFSTDIIPDFLGRISCWYSAGIHRDIGTIESLLAAQQDEFWNSCPLEEDEKWIKSYRQNAAVKRISEMLDGH